MKTKSLSLSHNRVIKFIHLYIIKYVLVRVYALENISYVCRVWMEYIYNIIMSEESLNTKNVLKKNGTFKVSYFLFYIRVCIWLLYSEFDVILETYRYTN